MTEKERFSAYILQEYNSNVVWHEGNPIKAMDLMLWLAWQAATQREGFKFVPVGELSRKVQNIRALNTGEYASDEIEENVCGIEAMIGAVDDH